MQWKQQAAVATGMRCWRCSLIGRNFGGPLDCHEMVRRSRAPKLWAHPANYLLVCRECHCTVFVNMPLTNQLIFKLLVDPDGFDTDIINIIAGRNPGNAITLASVIRALKRHTGELRL